MAFDHVRNRYEKKGVFVCFCFLGDGMIYFFLVEFRKN